MFDTDGWFSHQPSAISLKLFLADCCVPAADD